RPRRVAGADAAGVFAVGDVADVVQRLDSPVAADVVGEVGRAGLAGGQVGDRVDGHGGPAALGEGADPAGDADGLGGVGELQVGDGDDLQAADLITAVAAVAGRITDRHVAPGQGLEPAVQVRLVAFDDAHVRGAFDTHQVVDVLALGVHRI